MRVDIFPLPCAVSGSEKVSLYTYAAMHTNLNSKNSSNGCLRLTPLHLRAKAISSTSPPIKKAKKYFNKTNPTITIALIRIYVRMPHIASALGLKKNPSSFVVEF